MHALLAKETQSRKADNHGGVSKARLKAISDPGDPRHGSLNFYVNFGCRCSACRAANARRDKRGHGKTGRVNRSRPERIRDVLLQHHRATIAGLCSCGYMLEGWDDLEMHRGRMISNELYGTHFDDRPVSSIGIHAGGWGAVYNHHAAKEALCQNCLSFLEQNG
jgi:hypothetical protein